MLQAEQILQGRYQLKQLLGENRGRQTWLATDIKASLLEFVTVKLLAMNPQMQWDDLKLFEREARVLENLDHPRIPKYRDYFSVNEQEGGGFSWFGLVQQYFPGTSLKQGLEKGKPFTETEGQAIVKQVLDILIYLHELSPPVLHRDIKPSNLIWGEDSQIYLVDFGAVQDKAKAEGATFTVVGSSGYAPPEQLWGKAVPASDLYALGATLIHLLTGTSPAELPQQQMQIQFQDKLSIAPDFANWLEQMLQPALERRFSTARQALKALQTSPASSSQKEHAHSSVSRSLKYGYGCLLILLSLSCVPATLWMLRGIYHPPKSKASEGWWTVGNLNDAQQGYFDDKRTFANSLADLETWCKVKQETKRYCSYFSNFSNRWRIKEETKYYTNSFRVTDRAVFNYSILKPTPVWVHKILGESTDRSYVGAVFIVPATSVDPTAPKNEMTTLSIRCRADSPGAIKPAEPILQNGEPVCPPGTTRTS